MARFQSINPFSKVNNDTGFGSNPNYGGRFINRDGTFNVKKEGHPFWERFSVFHTFLTLSTSGFATVIITCFIAINLAFTFLYVLAGPREFQGLLGTTSWAYFKELFFFSAQTFTTVGYGRVNPVGDIAGLISSIEAMLGFMSFAIVTGLIYGRFARPKAFLAFSDDAIIGPYRGAKALMFRFASIKDNHTLTDVVIRVNVALLATENGKSSYKFYDLALERSRVDNLPMNWTVVHPIDDTSPLLGLTEENMKTSDLEVYVLVKGFDDVFSNSVLQRTSYTYAEIKFNRKFVPMYRESDNGGTTILELHKINQHVDTEIL